MKKIITALLIFLFSFGVHGFSQDSTFIYNYKEFRSLVDSCKTFSLYIVPYQSSYLHPIPTSSGYFKNAFHFLRNKKVVRYNADFRIAVLIDSLVLDQVVEERVRASNVNDFRAQRRQDSSKFYKTPSGSDLTNDTYVTKYYYLLTYNLAVETINKQTYIFPLANNEKIVVSSSLNNKNISYQILQRRLEDILLRYKDYYIDRVDW